MAQGDLKSAGRDHGPYGFTAWMAGGGTKGGTVYGSTDEIGYASVENTSAFRTGTQRFCTCWDYVMKSSFSTGTVWANG